MENKKIEFTDCLKGFTTDQDKAISPEKTLQRFYKQVKKLDVNIVHEVRRIDTGRLDIPVFFSMCGDAASAVTGTKKQMGKGASPVQAEASACMELAERFSFFSFKSDPENFIVGDYPTMRENGYPVVSLEMLLQSVHDTANKPEVLEELLHDIPMQWCWGTNVTTGKNVFIPFSWFFAINEFNGPSAGNTLEEAALQGICEIIERHVCSIISRQKIPTPSVDLSTLKDPVAIDLVKKFAKNNIELYVNDFSLDTNIPTMGAIAIDRSTFPEKSEIVYTAGTCPDPEKAFIRTVTEVAQLAGDFESRSNYVASGLPKPLSMDEVDYITDASGTVSIDEMADQSDQNIKNELLNCISQVKNAGMEVMMIDVSHTQLQIPAMYTIIPGAHFRERSAIGNAGLFAAKLAAERIDNPSLLEEKLKSMEALLPNSYFIEFYRGKTHYSLGCLEEAIEHFSASLLLNPEEEDIPYIYSFKGSCEQMLERWDDAISTLTKGLEADEERPDIYNMLGVCHFKKGEYEKAVSAFERAVELNPASAMDHANLGVNHKRLGNREMAVQCFTIALTLDPGLDFVKNELEDL